MSSHATIEYNGNTYEFSYNIHGVVGSCGTASVNCMTVPRVVREMEPKNRRAVAYLLGQKILSAVRRRDYGVALFTTLSQNAPMADPFSAYYGSSEDGHKEEFNLGTIARALGGRKGVSARNPNTGNVITSYTVATAPEEL